MALELIKEYLVGIGFDIDLNSLNTAEQSINSADKTIKNFNDNSNKGFSESFDSMKDLFSLFSSSSGVIGKLFPELQTPFKNLIGDISTVKKLYKDLSGGEAPKKNKESSEKKENKNTESKPLPPKENDNPKPKQYKENKNTNNDKDNEPKPPPKPKPPKQEDNREKIKEPPKQNNTPKPKEPRQETSKDNSIKDNSSNILNPLDELMTRIIEKTKEMGETSNVNIGGMVSSLGDLSSEGGGALATFSVGAVASFAAVAAAVVAVVLATKELAKFLNDLAKQDIAYEKLSRQLWTTKENAKEVDMALKAMGATMQDLWLSPTLMKQFTQLRKDSAALKLPKEYTDNLKVVQGISLEFLRLKQFGELAFQWIGNYILKYAAKPLAEFKESFHTFNDGLLKTIPKVARVLGSIVGAVIKVASAMAKIVPIFVLFKMFDKLPDSVKKFGETVFKIIMAISQPILLIIGLIDDLITAFSGGKSVIGSILGFSNDKKKETLTNVGTKVQDYSNNPRINTVPSNYATNNTSNSSVSTTSNSNNKVSNQNTFNVYGGKDANSTGNVVANKVNGLNTRNMQGVFGS